MATRHFFRGTSQGSGAPRGVLVTLSLAPRRRLRIQAMAGSLETKEPTSSCSEERRSERTRPETPHRAATGRGVPSQRRCERDKLPRARHLWHVRGGDCPVRCGDTPGLDRRREDQTQLPTARTTRERQAQAIVPGEVGWRLRGGEAGQVLGPGRRRARAETGRRNGEDDDAAARSVGVSARRRRVANRRALGEFRVKKERTERRRGAMTRPMRTGRRSRDTQCTASFIYPLTRNPTLSRHAQERVQQFHHFRRPTPLTLVNHSLDLYFEHPTLMRSHANSHSLSASSPLPSDQ